MAELDSDLVHTIAEELRQFRLRLGENTAGFIAAGRRVIELSGGERRDLAMQLAELVDRLAEHRRVAGAGPGRHVLLTVDPDRNGGRASFSTGMVPLYAVLGPLNAGDSPEHVREEYGLDESQVVVAAALVDDFVDLAAGDEPPPEEDVCRPVPVFVDGREEVIALHGREPMTEQDRAVFAELVSAARSYSAALNPNLGVVQELLAAARVAAWCIPDGVVHTRFGTSDGTQVKERLRAAARAARDALTPQKDGGANV